MRTTGGHNIKINGRLVNIHLARLVYRCEVCFGSLRRVDHGLKCQANPEHRGFIHRNEVARIEQQRAQNIETLEKFYEVVDGKVVNKWQSQD